MIWLLLSYPLSYFKVYEKFPVELHGFRKSDINRDNRQNWRSAQRLSIQKLQGEKLTKIRF